MRLTRFDVPGFIKAKAHGFSISNASHHSAYIAVLWNQRCWSNG